MSNLTGVYFSLGLLFLIGFGMQKIKKYSSEGIQTFTSVILDIFFPIYIFYMLTTNPIVKDMSKLFIPILCGLGASLLAYFVAPILSRPVIKTDSDRTSNGLMQLIGNYAFLGLPLAESIFGSEGLAYTVMIKIGMELVIFSIGLGRIRSESGKFKIKDMVSPLLVATLLGLVIGQFTFTYPGWMADILQKTSTAVTPLGFLVCGIITGNVKIKNFYFGKIIYISLIKMIVMPLLVFLIGRLIGLDETLLGILTIYYAMPFGVTAAMFLERYGHESDLASVSVVFATLISPFILISLSWLISVV